MKKILGLLTLTLTFLFGFSLENINAQNDYNKTDNQGRRQGKWIDFHDNGKTRYIGEFKNNEPIGEFLYYSFYFSNYNFGCLPHHFILKS